MNFFRGLFYGIVFSIPLWIIIALIGYLIYRAIMLI